MPRLLTAEEFWSRVDQSGGPGACWPWRSTMLATGYGSVDFDGATKRSHRVAFFLTHGRWPEPCCCHRCDNRPCCNPDHLFEGTYADNHADMDRKGRRKMPDVRGAAHPMAKLDEKQVREIRGYQGLSKPGTVARHFGVGRGTIHEIWKRKTWAHLED